MGLSESSYYYRHHPRPPVADPIPHTQRCGSKRISDKDREHIATLLRAGFDQGLSVRQIFYQHVDSGERLLAGERMFYRIAQSLRDPVIRPRRHREPATVPTVTATGPGQVFVWDVTWVKGPYVRALYALHVVMDLYSRKIVGWTLQPRENKNMAVMLMEQTIKQEGLGRVEVVHSDNGAIMTSKDMARMLDRYGVKQSLIRPGVSNDNPHCESVNHTIKHHRLGLEVYDSIEHAYTCLGSVISTYNTVDYHSGIANFVPEQVFDGSWVAAAKKRREVLGRYYAAHPERFHRPPRVKRPRRVVSINARRVDDEYFLIE
ncbi:integrase catalytic subunit [Corynebacterium crudilactis]|uniref:Integrase catalytic subunit n=1 Tax=Corynebacterium crudilactis TaxID=1652495 RepID=A0A172QXA6_9CORY|nr:integrase catalytic subunit [Corynebacterium crudilactis]